MRGTPLADFVPPWKLAGVNPETPVLLALSGGADSVALLRLLSEQSETDAFPLLLAHVNHGIRGAEALRDRTFCEMLARQYGLELCILDVDVPSLAAEHGRGLEEEAREVRYGYLKALMAERNIPLLATAHHADDNLETLLFRLARGSGLRGMCGIPPVRSFGTGMLTRPLLRCAKRDILAYCRENKLEYVTDSTNADQTYARNRIRAEIVPVLESVFPNPQKSAARLTGALSADENLLESLAAEAAANCRSGGGLSRDALCVLHPALQRRVLATWVRERTGHEPENVHLEALGRLVENIEAKQSTNLPGGFYAVNERGILRLRSRREPAEPFCVPFREGETSIPESGAVISVHLIGKNEKINNLSIAACIILSTEFAIIEKELFWRPRQPGDLLLRGGIHRKLRKLYGAAGIPLDRRERMPLLCDTEGIVWAPFAGLRDGIPTEGECYRVCVTFPQEDGTEEFKTKENDRKE